MIQCICTEYANIFQFIAGIQIRLPSNFEVWKFRWHIEHSGDFSSEGYLKCMQPTSYASNSLDLLIWTGKCLTLERFFDFCYVGVLILYYFWE